MARPRTFFVCTDTDGTLWGVGVNEDWARFDTARSTLSTSYAMDDFLTSHEAGPIDWARSRSAVGFTLNVDDDNDWDCAVAGMLDCRLDAVPSLIAELRSQESLDPPWEVLPKFPRGAPCEDNEDLFWWKPDHYITHRKMCPAGASTVYTRVERLLAIHGSVPYSLGHPVLFGDRMEVLADYSSTMPYGVDPENVEMKFPLWVSGQVISVAETGEVILKAMRHPSLVLRLGHGARHVDIPLRGRKIAPVLDLHPAVPNENWANTAHEMRVVEQ